MSDATIGPEPDIADRHGRHDEPGGDELYVGYLPDTPPGIRRFAQRTIFLLAGLLVGFAVALPLLQATFDPGRFEFGTTRTFTGLLREHPYPILEVPTPGATDGEAGGTTPLLLVDVGKRGARQRVAGLDGQTVSSTGTLAARPDLAVLELSETPEPVSTAIHPPSVRASSRREVTLSGEIVDSKCFAGVMKPGRDKVHRSCAARCIAGGIPPLFAARGESGVEIYLLVDAMGDALTEEILPFVGEPVRITGRTRTGESFERRRELPLLFVEPDQIERIGRTESEPR